MDGRGQVAPLEVPELLSPQPFAHPARRSPILILLTVTASPGVPGTSAPPASKCASAGSGSPSRASAVWAGDEGTRAVPPYGRAWLPARASADLESPCPRPRRVGRS